MRKIKRFFTMTLMLIFTVSMFFVSIKGINVNAAETSQIKVKVLKGDLDSSSESSGGLYVGFYMDNFSGYDIYGTAYGIKIDGVSMTTTTEKSVAVEPKIYDYDGTNILEWDPYEVYERCPLFCIYNVNSDLTFKFDSEQDTSYYIANGTSDIFIGAVRIYNTTGAALTEDLEISCDLSTDQDTIFNRYINAELKSSFSTPSITVEASSSGGTEGGGGSSGGSGSESGGTEEGGSTGSSSSGKTYGDTDADFFYTYEIVDDFGDDDILEYKVILNKPLELRVGYVFAPFVCFAPGVEMLDEYYRNTDYFLYDAEHYEIVDCTAGYFTSNFKISYNETGPVEVGKTCTPIMTGSMAETKTTNTVTQIEICNIKLKRKEGATGILKFGNITYDRYYNTLEGTIPYANYFTMTIGSTSNSFYQVDDYYFGQTFIDINLDGGNMPAETFEIVLANIDNNGSTKTVTASAGYIPSDLIDLDTYKFEGWSLTSGGSLITDWSSVTYEEGTTLYAVWSEKEATLVIFDAAGGEFSDGTTMQFASEYKLTKDINIPIRDGHLFAGWYLSSSYTGNAITYPYVLSESITLYAKWVKLENASISSAPSAATVVLNQSSELDENGYVSYDIILVNPTSDLNFTTVQYTYSFQNMQVLEVLSSEYFNAYIESGVICATAVSGGLNNYFQRVCTISLELRNHENLKYNTLLKLDNTALTVKANDDTTTLNLNNAEAYLPMTILKTASFNTNFGSEIASVTAESILLSNYIPTKNNFIFDGWYLTKDFSGSAVDLDTPYSLLYNTVFYAKWTAADELFEIYFTTNVANNTLTIPSFDLSINIKYPDGVDLTEYQLSGFCPLLAFYDLDGNVLSFNDYFEYAGNESLEYMGLHQYTLDDVVYQYGCCIEDYDKLITSGTIYTLYNIKLKETAYDLEGFYIDLLYIEDDANTQFMWSNNEEMGYDASYLYAISQLEMTINSALISGDDTYVHALNDMYIVQNGITTNVTISSNQYIFNASAYSFYECDLHLTVQEGGTISIYRKSFSTPMYKSNGGDTVIPLPIISKTTYFILCLTSPMGNSVEYSLTIVSKATENDSYANIKIQPRDNTVYDSYYTGYVYFDVYVCDVTYAMIDFWLTIYLDDNIIYADSEIHNNDLCRALYLSDNFIEIRLNSDSSYVYIDTSGGDVLIASLKVQISSSADRSNDIVCNFTARTSINYAVDDFDADYDTSTETTTTYTFVKGISPYVTQVDVYKGEKEELINSFVENLNSIYTYTLNGVDYTVDKITFNIIFGTGLTVTINGTEVTSGEDFVINLNTGDNEIEVVSGVLGSLTQITYTFSITRDSGSSDSSISSVLVDTTNAVLSGDTYSTDLVIQYSNRNSVEVTITLGNEYATITVTYGEQVFTGVGSLVFTPSLVVGDNELNILVESQNKLSSLERTLLLNVADADALTIDLVDDAITEKDYDGLQFVTPEYVVKANGVVVNVECDVKYYDGETLLDDAPINAGDYKLVISLTGNDEYYDTEATFDILINKIDLSEVTQEDFDSSYDFIGQEIDLLTDIKLTYLETELALGTDYTYDEATTELYNAGNHTITFTGCGNFTGTRLVYYSIAAINIKDADYKFTVDNTEYIKGTTSLSKQYTYNNAQQVPTFNKFTLIIDSNEVVIDESQYTITSTDGINAGEQRLTFTAKANSNIIGSFDLTYLINQYSINGVLVLIDQIPDQNYTGLEVALEDLLNIVYSVNPNYTLVCGKDFEIVYPSDVVDSTKKPINVGEYEITINGIGNFYDSAVASFEIVPLTMNEANAEITMDCETYVYTGKQITPQLTINFNGSPIDLDMFDITYGENINAGTGAGQIYIKSKEGASVYCDMEKIFNIEKFDIANANFDKKSSITADSEITVDTILTKIWIGDNSEEGILTKDIDYTAEVNVGSSSLGTLLINGIGNNFKGTKTFTFDIVSRVLSEEEVEITIEEGPFEFNWEYIRPDVSVSVVIDDETLELVEGEDYELEYYDNYNASTNAYVKIIISTEEYSGEFTRYFEIGAKTLTLDMISPISDRQYTGEAIIIDDLEVKDGTNNLNRGSGVVYYNIVEYLNNTNAGIATIKLEGVGNFTGEVSTTFNIVKVSADGFELVFELDSNIYTGSEIIPNVILKNGEEVISNEYYDITYPKDVKDSSLNPTNVGTYEITVTLKDDADINYSGTFTQSYSIIEKELDESMLTDDSIVPSRVYNGYEYTIDDLIELVYNEMSLSWLIDYNISYTDNVNAGIVTATIKAIDGGNYSGEFDITYEIEKLTSDKVEDDTFNVVLDQTEFTFNDQEQKPNLTIYIGTTEIKEFTYAILDRETNIEDITNVGYKDITITINDNNIDTTISKEYQITKFDISGIEVEDIPTQTYTGSEIVPTIVINALDRTLNIDTEYTVECSNNTNVTTSEAPAEMTITGKGNFTGTIFKTFQIGTAAGDEFTVVDIDDQIFTGSAIEPTVKVMNGEVEITSDYYDLSYTANINVGLATITITFKNGYDGFVNKTFNIIAKDISELEFDLVNSDYTYTGAGIDISDDILAQYNGVNLLASTDYNITYLVENSNINVGTVEFKLVGKGNYTGEYTGLSYTISPINLTTGDELTTGFDITLEETEFVYNGLEHTPQVNVLLNNNAIQTMIGATGEADILIEYLNNISYVHEDDTNHGVATVVLTGNGQNITGTYSLEFSIARATLTQDNVTYNKDFSVEVNLAGGKFEYEDLEVSFDGNLLEPEKDYSISYKNNDTAGEASFVITGIGNYAGTIIQNFTIVETVVDSDDIIVEILDAESLFTGNTILPAISVTIDSVVLDSEWYTVEADSNYDCVNVGTAGLIVTLKSGYSGTKNVEYQISPRDISDENVIYTPEPIEYNVSGFDASSINLVLGTYFLEEGAENDYTILVAPNGAGIHDVYLEGCGNFTGNRVISVEIVPVDALASEFVVSINNESSLIYSGEALIPEIVVKYNNVELSYLESGLGDYTYKILLEDQELEKVDGVYQMINANTYTIQIVLDKNFNVTDDVTKACKVKALSLTDPNTEFSISNIPDQKYTGSAITVENILVIKNNTAGTNLEYNVDYKLGYTSNTAIGDALVIITGLGNYTGTKTTTFTIAETVISIIGFIDGSPFKYINSNFEEYERTAYDPEATEHVVVGNVKVGLTIEQVISQLTVTTSQVKVYNAKGVEIPAESYSTATITTSTRIDLMNGEDVADSVYFSVLGDTNGDGRTMANDAARIYGYVKGTTKIDGLEYLVAFDTTGEGRIMANDAARIYAYVKGTINLYDGMDLPVESTASLEISTNVLMTIEVESEDSLNESDETVASTEIDATNNTLDVGDNTSEETSEIDFDIVYDDKHAYYVVSKEDVEVE